MGCEGMNRNRGNWRWWGLTLVSLGPRHADILSIYQVAHDFTSVIDIILPVIKGRVPSKVQQFRHESMRYNEKDVLTRSTIHT